MSSAENLGSSRLPSRPTKPTTSSNSEMLTSSEIQQLRRVQREQHDYARKAFAYLRPKAAQDK